MRTDSINLSEEAIKSIGKYIQDTYGKLYHQEKNWKGKSKNTQEAHEAVRPTHIEIKGLTESGKIGSDELKLYQLIWKRAIASQMTPAKFSVATTHISISKLKDYYYSTQIDTLIFDGFLKVYNIKNIEETENSNIQTKIPQLGEKLECSNITSTQDYERPQPRYDEASLINKLDPKNLNIGRPSTYATIINKIQERGYVEKKENEGIEKECLELIFNGKKIEDSKFKISLGKDSNRLTPTALGKIVTEFLIQYFPQIMDYKFTSDMEQKLDDVAEGKLKWTLLMDKFYNTEFHPIIENIKKEKIKFVDKDRKVLGKDPTSGEDIIVTMRRFGPVVMIEKGKKTLNIAPIKAPLTVDNITLENALEILSYPKLLGKYEKKDIYLYRGKYGFYAKFGDKNINLSKFENEEDITIDVISELIKEVKSKYLWEGVEGKVEYKVLEGPYGKFINIKDTSKKTAKPLNIKFPEGVEIKDLTLSQIKNLVEEGKKNKFRRKPKAQ
jgi:DNA topoisomerase-1